MIVVYSYKKLTCLNISFSRKILADFKMGGPKMVGPYLNGPNNGRNGFQFQRPNWGRQGAKLLAVIC